MRIRSVLALTTGAALGAGSMYLLDPDHGEARRRDARRRAARQLREGTVRAALDAKRRAEEVAIAAVAGYQQARADSAPAGELHRLDERRAG